MLSYKQTQSILIVDVWWCHLRGLWVVIWPDSFKLIEVMSAQHSPVSGQILKVIHDDSDEQVNDLRKHRLDQFITEQNCLLFSETDYWKFSVKSTELQNFCEWSTKGNAKLLWINTKCLRENTYVMWVWHKVSLGNAKQNVFHLLPGRHRVQRNWWNRGMPGCFRSYTPLPAHSQTPGHIDVLAVLQAWSVATVHLLHTWVWRRKRKKTCNIPLLQTIY